MIKTETVRAFVPSEIKERARAVVEPLGLTMSDAIRMFLIRLAADKAMPFEVEPNAASHGVPAQALPDGSSVSAASTSMPD